MLFFVLVCLYVLFYATLMKTESTTVVISDITPDTFKKLFSEHSESLSCPCTTSSIPYKNFVSNNVTMHPVCLSDFIDRQWIEGLYFTNASLYTFWDFRTTAYSQVRHSYIFMKVILVFI